MNAATNFLRLCVAHGSSVDYMYLIQWFKSLFWMTEFTRETIPILILGNRATDLLLEFLEQCFEQGYSTPITDADELTNELIETKLIIPVIANGSNYLDVKSRLLDFHSCMMAGKFFIITNDISLANTMESRSFKLIGKEVNYVNGYTDALDMFEIVIKKKLGPSFIRDLVLSK